jgi:hypothetical protein
MRSSLDDEQPEEGAAAEWSALAEERMDDVRTGTVEGVPAGRVWHPVDES